MVNPYFDNYFDMVYYMNLDSRPDRNEQSMRMIHDLNINKFKRIQSVKAEDVNAMDIGLIDHKRSISKNNKACKLSHFKCIQDALDNGYEKICIFEDDFCFNQDDPTIKENLEDHLKTCFHFLENYEWMFFYFDNTTSVDMVDRVAQGLRRLPPNKGSEIPDTPVRVIEGELVRPDTGGKYRPANGKALAHSYALKGRYIMERILKYERDLSMDKLHNAIREDRHFYPPGLFDQLIGCKSDNAYGYSKRPRK